MRRKKGGRERGGGREGEEEEGREREEEEGRVRRRKGGRGGGREREEEEGRVRRRKGGRNRQWERMRVEGGENEEGLKLPQRIKIVAILIIIHYNNHTRIFAAIFH